jgi:hypothetical protein
MTAVATQAGPEVTIQKTQEFLKTLLTETLPALNTHAGKKESLFFRNGIELVKLRAAIRDLADFEIVLAGPKPLDTQSELGVVASIGGASAR